MKNYKTREIIGKTSKNLGNCKNLENFKKFEKF